MKRRAALRLGGAALAGALGGCSSIGGPARSPVVVESITLRNRLDRDLTASVLLVDDGEVAYWESVPVPADPNPFATIESLPSEAGVYELYAHLPAFDDDPPVQADLTEDAGDQSCLTVGMAVTTARVDGEDVPALSYGTVGEC